MQADSKLAVSVTSQRMRVPYHQFRRIPGRIQIREAGSKLPCTVLSQLFLGPTLLQAQALDGPVLEVDLHALNVTILIHVYRFGKRQLHLLPSAQIPASA